MLFQSPILGDPGALSALLVNMRRFISLPDLFPLAPANRPWVSEDVKVLVSFLFFLLHKKMVWTQE